MNEANEHWTIDEFKEYRETGRRPAKKYTPPEVPEWVKDRILRGSGLEKTLQTQCEGWLGVQECLPMTSAMSELAQARSMAGRYETFYGHIPDTKRSLQRNLFLPDLVILHPERVPLMVELKTRCEFQAGQLEMVLLGYWQLCATLDDFIDAYNQWVWEWGWYMQKHDEKHREKREDCAGLIVGRNP